VTSTPASAPYFLTTSQTYRRLALFAGGRLNRYDSAARSRRIAPGYVVHPIAGVWRTRYSGDTSATPSSHRMVSWARGMQTG
jgi:hypothetical protein